MATTFSIEVVRDPTGDLEPGTTGSFDITDNNAVIDFVIRLYGVFIVIYHTT